MDTIKYDEIQSKKWDMDIPLEALVDYNEGKCLCRQNYKNYSKKKGKYTKKFHFAIKIN